MLWGAVAVHAVLMSVVAFFRDDVRRGGFFSFEGAVHDVVSGMAFSALVVAMLGALAIARVERSLRPLRSATLFLGGTMTGIGIAFIFTPPEVQGIPQRAFMGLAALWLLFLAALSRRSLGR
jgi:hypothetical protein